MAASFQRLNADDTRPFAEDGCVLKRGYFLAEEVRLAQRMIETDPAIRANVLKIADNEGGSTALALWNQPGEDVFGAIARCERVAGGARRCSAARCTTTTASSP
jgi:hypothetical protein